LYFSTGRMCAVKYLPARVFLQRQRVSRNNLCAGAACVMRMARLTPSVSTES
jgi:hypothetical protein